MVTIQYVSLDHGLNHVRGCGCAHRKCSIYWTLLPTWAWLLVTMKWPLLSRIIRLRHLWHLQLSCSPGQISSLVRVPPIRGNRVWKVQYSIPKIIAALILLSTYHRGNGGMLNIYILIWRITFSLKVMEATDDLIKLIGYLCYSHWMDQHVLAPKIVIIVCYCIF